MNPPRFFNTLSGRLETFEPIRPPEVGLYTCGPTVYDYAHIGNFRTFVFEDLLRRFLEFEGYRVKHVMNITDVDDKTIAGARRDGKSLEAYTGFYLEAFHRDLDALNILAPTIEPRATREIAGPGGIVELIQKLIAAGSAYESDGSVYYRVASFPAYGRLSKKNLEGNIAGARVDVDEYAKEELSDFALWKKAREEEPAWDSPWGSGRPGWHIECSAMSMKHLGPSFDLHCGGEDLIFPHHENEIAQSEAASGRPFVRTWLHAKHLLVDGEKMSKSKGNFYTLRDLEERGFDPAAVRFALLSAHYRSPLNFTLAALKESTDAVRKLDDCFAAAYSLSREASLPHGESPAVASHLREKMRAIRDALADDLNVSAAFAAVFEAVKFLNRIFAELRTLAAGDLALAAEFFRDLDALFGLGIVWEGPVSADADRRLSERAGVRKDPAFKTDPALRERSDVLRREIESLGWLIRDGRPGDPSVIKKKRRVWD